MKEESRVLSRDGVDPRRGPGGVKELCNYGEEKVEESAGF